MLDARIASALNKSIQNSHFKQKVSLKEQKAQKEDRFFFFPFHVSCSVLFILCVFCVRLIVSFPFLCPRATFFSRARTVRVLGEKAVLRLARNVFLHVNWDVPLEIEDRWSKSVAGTCRRPPLRVLEVPPLSPSAVLATGRRHNPLCIPVERCPLAFPELIESLDHFSFADSTFTLGNKQNTSQRVSPSLHPRPTLPGGVCQ